MIVYWIHLPEHTNVALDGYVGVATNFDQRMFAHKSCAKTGKEQTLYKAIRKYGWDTLVKEIILVSHTVYCLEIEKKLRPTVRIGWNIACGGGEITGVHLKGVKQSPEHIANRKKALLGRVSGMKGKKQSDKAKNISRNANLGKVLSAHSKQKISLKNSQAIKINDVVYESWQVASIKTGIPTGSLSYLLKGQIGPRSKYKWINQMSLVM